MWAARLAQAAVEVLAGHRPVTQLQRWTTEELYLRLRRLTGGPRVRDGAHPASRRARYASVRAIRVSQPADGVAEVAAVVDDGGHAHALVLRLEGSAGRWRCTELARV
jgi:hypothetical protein